MCEDFIKKGGTEKEWKAKWKSYSDDEKKVCIGLQSHLIFTQLYSVRRRQRKHLYVISSIFPVHTDHLRLFIAAIVYRGKRIGELPK